MCSIRWEGIHPLAWGSSALLLLGSYELLQCLFLGVVVGSTSGAMTDLWGSEYGNTRVCAVYLFGCVYVTTRQ